MTTFVLDSNLGLPTGEKPWSDILAGAGIETIAIDDLPRVDEMVARHEADIAFIPAADFHRLVGKGDRHYRGLAIATSKFTGQPTLRSLLVVRNDDPARSLDDLSGARYGYINRSCSSTYSPPAIRLQRQGRTLEEFLEISQVKPGPSWQGLVDAVVSGEIRATIVLEDVWKSSPENERTTKVIGSYDGGKPPVVIVRDGLDEAICRTLLDALLAWAPRWEAVFGGFKPFYYCDVHPFFHDLDALPPGT